MQAMVRLVLTLTVVLSGCTTPPRPDSERTSSPGTPADRTVTTCPVTEPSPVDTYPTQIAGTQGRAWYGTGRLWVELHNFALAAPRGERGLRVKHAWWTGDASAQSGPPQVRATLLHGSLHADVTFGGYAHSDGLSWWPVGLVFPTPGCWRVTGELDDQTLQFVVRIVPRSDRATDGP